MSLRPLRIPRALGAGLALASLVWVPLACRTRAYNAGTRATAPEPSRPKTACVGIQGNGIRFPSHVGTFTALLEADILPVATLGGSSGSIVGSAVMALLGNASVETGSASAGGRSLTKAQRAALVLAATPDVLNSFLFLPSVQIVTDFLASVVQFAYSTLYGRALLGDDAARIVSLESTVGQAVLLVDFFSHADFTTVLSLPTYEARRAKVRELWMAFAEAREVSLGALLRAGAMPEEKAKLDPDLKDVSDRLYYMFQRDVSETTSPSEAWRSVLQGVDLVRRSGVLGPLEGRLESMKLIVPHPRLVWNAYLSRSKEGRFIDIPKGMIIHSTFRRGSYRTKNGTLDFTEAAGIDTLFQGYTASEPLFSDILRVRDARKAAGKGFLPYAGEAGAFAYAYPADRVLAFRTYEGTRPYEQGPFNETRIPTDGERLLKDGRRGVAHGIAYSAGEPGPFRRLPVYLSDTERNDNPVLASLSDVTAADPREGIISFGGWSENVPLSTLGLLDACKDVDYFVTGAAPGPGNTFQEGAIRAALRGWDATKTKDKLYEFLFRKLPAGEEAVRAHFAALNANATFSLEAIKEDWWGKGEAAPRVVRNDLAFDAPSELSDAEPKLKSTLDGALSNDRFALLVASYQRIRRNMPPSARESAIDAFGQDLASPEKILATKRTVSEIETVLGGVR